MNYNEVGKQIITQLGGEGNVSTITHCYTRLRLTLKDENKVNVKEIDKIEGVLKTVKSVGQFQIVLGNNVTKVYEAILADTSLKISVPTEEKEQKKSVFSKVIDTIAGIFTPCIGIMAACGMIAGLLVIFTKMGLLTAESGTYQVYNIIANAATYFLPIILAISASKKFKTNTMVSVIIAASLIHPNMVTFLATEGAINFMGIKIFPITYASSVFPIILSLWVLSYLEKFLNKIVPEIVKIVFVPLLSLAVMVPFTLLVFGPIGNMLSLGLSNMYTAIIGMSPVLAGGFLGGLWGIFVMFGIHRTLIPIGISDMMATGATSLFAFTGMTAFAQAGAALGVAIRTKDKAMKTAATSGTITGLLGISEPAIYGVNLKYKRPMIYGIIGGALGGMIAGFGGAKAYAPGMASVITLPIFIGNGFMYFLIAIVVAFVSSCLLTVILGFKEIGKQDSNEEATNTEKKNKNLNQINKISVMSPISGTCIKLEEVPDTTFASKVIGEGLAILPEEGIVYAPFNGIVTGIFHTNHAIGLTNQDGVEVLIHIGIDTVNLQGKYYRCFVEQGAKVACGDKLIEFDIDNIKKAGYQIVTPIVVTNSSEFLEVVASGSSSLCAGDLAISVIK